jgi:hypothetical protein
MNRRRFLSTIAGAAAAAAVPLPAELPTSGIAIARAAIVFGVGDIVGFDGHEFRIIAESELRIEAGRDLQFCAGKQWEP